MKQRFVDLQDDPIEEVGVEKLGERVTRRLSLRHRIGRNYRLASAAHSRASAKKYLYKSLGPSVRRYVGHARVTRVRLPKENIDYLSDSRCIIKEGTLYCTLSVCWSVGL